MLGIDILGPPFSSMPPNNNIPAWEESLRMATTTALKAWMRSETAEDEVRDAVIVASLCLYRPQLLIAYREMFKKLMGGWWRWGQTIALDSEQRWNVLGEICGWDGHGVPGLHGSEL
ncbi:hypothetical protein MFIFM68171_10252 [Madurella fahalii]|uniref:Uncharacterized protein n=1 Tax=Madurella fahalii TaxID=1157608 RepID=A0ABQ0GQM5_9PEZI